MEPSLRQRGEAAQELRPDAGMRLPVLAPAAPMLPKCVWWTGANLLNPRTELAAPSDCICLDLSLEGGHPMAHT